MNIVYPPTVEWSKLTQRPHHIMRKFAEDGWDAIYCDKTLNPTTVIDSGIENLSVCLNPTELEHKFSEKGGSTLDVLYCTWPKSYEWVDRLNPRFVIYDCVDHFDAWAQYEDDMVKRADVILTTATRLYSKLGKKHPRVFFVPNACERSHIAGEVEIQQIDLAQVFGGSFDPDKPVVGFVGFVGQWVNQKILREISEEMNLVIVGTMSNTYNLPNALFAGHVPFDELPNWYASFDVGVTPFTFNETTFCADPIKTYEYLAAGLPVVSTGIPSAADKEPFVQTSNWEDFIESIYDVIDKKKDHEHMKAQEEWCRANTWDNRYDTIREIL